MRKGISKKGLFVLLQFILIFIIWSPCFTENLPIRIVHARDLLIKLDLSSQVLYLDIESDTNINSSTANAIYPISEIADGTPRGYIDSEVKYETQIKPTISSLSPYADFSFISASILVTKAKQFDDGLYAAIENLCQQGTKRFAGKHEILQQVFETLNKNDMGVEANVLAYSRGLIYAAADLGGNHLQTTVDAPSLAEKIKTDFLEKQWQAKPIGFYTWNDKLMKIFQQDRLLQQQLESEGVIGILARGVTKNKRTKLAYQQYMFFLTKLTNPFPAEFCELSKVSTIDKNKKYSFFPPSQSQEVELVQKLYAHRPIPEGFSLIDTFIAQIQQRKIDLTPNDQSGWYDYQIYALEPLVVPELMPESKKLTFSNNYKKELIDLFKAALALTRETHTKQASMGLEGAANVIHIYPKISTEPTASYYLRRAQSYGFIREVLLSTFAKTDLESNFRLTPAGQVSMPLWQELSDMETLFYGAYQMVCEEIGLTDNSQLLSRDQKNQQTAKEYFQKWKKTYTSDADLAVDNRMMVPVFYDVQRNKIKVWIFLGYASKPLAISFQKNPTAIITDVKGNKAEVFLKFDGETKSLIYPISAEVYVEKLLNREEFQTLCDENHTFSKILAALQKL